MKGIYLNNRLMNLNYEFQEIFYYTSDSR